MTGMTLHYLFDPLCGWCYGAAPLAAASRGLPGMALPDAAAYLGRPQQWRARLASKTGG